MRGSGLEVLIEERPGAIILHLRGQAEAPQLELLQARLGRVLAGGPRLVIIDLGHLDSMGKPAMQALALLRQSLIRQNGRVVLAGLSASLRQQLVDGGIDGLFPKVRDVRTVLARLER